MRILVLSKRQYTNLDLIDDRFGRLRELPLAIAAAGNEVTGVCLSYQPRPEGRIEDTEENSQVVWHTLNLRRLMPLGSRSYWRTIEKIGREFNPDLVWACSDAFHAILGVSVAKKFGAASVIDLYDNFESFPAMRFPGITSAFRRAIRHADGITCVSHPLAQYVRETAFYKGPIEVVGNAVPKGLFYPMDKGSCRQKLGLPSDGYLVGVAGAISKSRGIETLFRAFHILAKERPDIHLVLAGSRDKGLNIPNDSRVHYLGLLPPTEIPVLLSTLDVTVICNRESAFGKYCFPQKFHEAVACGVPVVAAGVGAMRELLKDRPECLFEPENTDDLVAALRRQIDHPITLPLEAPIWDLLGNQLEQFFKVIVNSLLGRAHKRQFS